MKDNWSPEQYEKFKKERSLPFYDLLALVQPKPKMDVIDLGCGTGELTAAMNNLLRARSTRGIDNSSAMLGDTTKYLAAGLEYANSDISKFDRIDCYDLIFANASLQWCGQHKLLFSKLRDGLRARGQLAVQMPANHDYPTHKIASELGTEWRLHGYLPELAEASNLLKPEEYAELLFRLGFKSQNVFTKVYAHVLPDRESSIEWVKGTLLTYYKSNLSTQRYKEFFDEYKCRLFKELPDDKPFFFPFKRLIMWGILN